MVGHPGLARCAAKPRTCNWFDWSGGVFGGISGLISTKVGGDFYGTSPVGFLSHIIEWHVWDFWLIVISATLNFCSKNQCEKSIIEAASLQYVFRSASVQSRRCQIRAPAMWLQAKLAAVLKSGSVLMLITTLSHSWAWRSSSRRWWMQISGLSRRRLPLLWVAIAAVLCQMATLEATCPRWRRMPPPQVKFTRQKFGPHLDGDARRRVFLNQMKSSPKFRPVSLRSFLYLQGRHVPRQLNKMALSPTPSFALDRWVRSSKHTASRIQWTASSWPKKH